MLSKRALPFALIAFVAPLLAGASAAVAQGQPSCPGDTVVWENTKTHVYHLSGDRYFGKTKSGAYACKADAEKNGFHASGQKGAAATGSSATGANPSASATPSGKHHRHKGGSASSASPAPGGSAAPSTASTPSGKHHHHHKGGAAASPAPSPAAT